MVDGFSLVAVPAAVNSQAGTGQQVYRTHCAECHGDNGDGNGFAAGSLPIPIMPTDFTRELLSEDAALRALRRGVAGTSMAPWGDRLSEQEMGAVTAYVRSLFQAGPRMARASTLTDADGSSP